MVPIYVTVVTQARVPDAYTQSLRAEGGHIRQATSACVTTVM